MDKIIPIATQVYAILQRRGITIAEAARRAGVNAVSLRNQIAGRKAMSEKQAAKILDAVKTPRDEWRRGAIEKQVKGKK